MRPSSAARDLFGVRANVAREMGYEEATEEQ